MSFVEVGRESESMAAGAANDVGVESIGGLDGSSSTRLLTSPWAGRASFDRCFLLRFLSLPAATLVHIVLSLSFFVWTCKMP